MPRADPIRHEGGPAFLIDRNHLAARELEANTPKPLPTAGRCKLEQLAGTKAAERFDDLERHLARGGGVDHAGSEKAGHVRNGGIPRHGGEQRSAGVDVIVDALPCLGAHMHRALFGGRERRRQPKQRVGVPVVELAGQVDAQPGAPRHHVGREQSGHQRGFRLVAGSRGNIRDRHVRGRGAVERKIEAGEIAACPRPLVRHQERDFGTRPLDAGEIHRACGLLEGHQGSAGRAQRAIGLRQSELRLVRRACIGRASVLLPVGVGVTPQKHTVGARRECRIDAGAVEVGHALGCILGIGCAEFLDQHGLAGSQIQGGRECRSVGSALGSHRIGKQLRLIDGVGMGAQKIDIVGNEIRPEGAVVQILGAGAHHDGMLVVFPADGAADQPGPVDRRGIAGIGNDPERRFIGEIPGDDRGFMGIAARELTRVVGLQAQHFRVRLRIAAGTPRHIPEGLADFAADEQRGMQIDPVSMRERDQIIELLECLRVVDPRHRFEPPPQEVDPHRVELQLRHPREVRFDRRRIPVERPEDGALGGHPMCACHHKSPASSREVVAIQLHGRQPVGRLTSNRVADGGRHNEMRQAAGEDRQLAAVDNARSDPCWYQHDSLQT